MEDGKIPCVIGVTGGIGSGKSQAVGILRGFGATVVDTDALVHRLQRRGRPLWRTMWRELGWAALAPDGELDRRRVGFWVFSDPVARRRVEALVHPAVRRALRAVVAARRRAGVRRLVVEIPLLVEAGWRAEVDQVWLVYAPEGLRLTRVVERDGLDPAAARERMAAQMPLEAKRPFADAIVNNTGGVDDLARALRALWDRCGSDG